MARDRLARLLANLMDPDGGRPAPTRNPRRALRLAVSRTCDEASRKRKLALKTARDPRERVALPELIGDPVIPPRRRTRFAPHAFGMFYGEAADDARMLVRQRAGGEVAIGDLIAIDDPGFGTSAYLLISIDDEGAWTAARLVCAYEVNDGDTIIRPMNDRCLPTLAVSTTSTHRLHHLRAALRIGWVHPTTLELVQRRLATDAEWRSPRPLFMGRDPERRLFGEEDSF